MDKKDVTDLVIASLREIILEQVDRDYSGALNGTTPLSGDLSILDSFYLVSLIVSIEQKLSEDHGITITLSGESALTREETPFKTVGTLADYICEIRGRGEPV